jgi:hypothetical protein
MRPNTLILELELPTFHELQSFRFFSPGTLKSPSVCRFIWKWKRPFTKTCFKWSDPALTPGTVPVYSWKFWAKTQKSVLDSQYWDWELNPRPLKNKVRFLIPPRHSAKIFTLLRITNPLVLITEKRCVSCAAVTQFLGTIYLKNLSE